MVTRFHYNKLLVARKAVEALQHAVASKKIRPGIGIVLWHYGNIPIIFIALIPATLKKTAGTVTHSKVEKDWIGSRTR